MGTLNPVQRALDAECVHPSFVIFIEIMKRMGNSNNRTRRFYDRYDLVHIGIRLRRRRRLRDAVRQIIELTDVGNESPVDEILSQKVILNVSVPLDGKCF